MANIQGKWSETLPADEKIQHICDEVKPQVEEKTGKNYETFRAIEYRSYFQFKYVTGINYLIKVHVGCDDHLIIGVFLSIQSIGKKGDLYRVEECHKDDPLIP